MKTISTSVKTGSELKMDNLKGLVSTYKHGKIKVLWYINTFSGFSCEYSTVTLNKMIKDGKIAVV